MKASTHTTSSTRGTTPTLCVTSPENSSDWPQFLATWRRRAVRHEAPALGDAGRKPPYLPATPDPEAGCGCSYDTNDEPRGRTTTRSTSHYAGRPHTAGAAVARACSCPCQGVAGPCRNQRPAQQRHACQTRPHHMTPARTVHESKHTHAPLVPWLGSQLPFPDPRESPKPLTHAQRSTPLQVFPLLHVAPLKQGLQELRDG